MIPNICWIGEPSFKEGNLAGDHGVGKRTQLLKYLESYAKDEGVPFHTKTKYLVGKLLNSISSSAGADSDSDDDVAASAPSADAVPTDGKYFPFEVSAIHQGYDVARMSLQDKNYIYTIFKGFQGSSYVLSKSNLHFFVFYHAHLLSEESIIFLQEKLEQYGNCLRIFMTSNYPLPHRLADHFIEVPVLGTENHLYRTLKSRFPLMPATPAWTTWFDQTFKEWYGTKWTAADVPAIRKWIYFCMQRNLRWCELIEYWTRAVQRSDQPTAAQRRQLYTILALAEGGGGWQIIPSYRIPLLWESVILSIIKVIGTFDEHTSNEVGPIHKTSEGSREHDK